jgi:hypothetical protein
MTEADAVRVAAALPDDAASRGRADEALGNALVGIVQRYLAQASNHWDVDLFFETYGRPPRDGSPWAQAIIDGLTSRTDIPESDRLGLIRDSKSLAIEKLRSQS